MNYRIHPAGLRHIELLSQLHTHCFAKGWGPLEFESFFERKGVFMALAYHEDALPVGFVVCWLIEDQCDLVSMGVLPDHRRDGVGLMLLDYALSEAKHMGAKAMLLEVNLHNKAAQTLYAEQGFEKFGIRKEYYSNADGSKTDAICMRKPLTDLPV